jgi:hypothetical protein
MPALQRLSEPTEITSIEPGTRRIMHQDPVVARADPLVHQPLETAEHAVPSGGTASIDDRHARLSRKQLGRYRITWRADDQHLLDPGGFEQPGDRMLDHRFPGDPQVLLGALCPNPASRAASRNQSPETGRI